MESAQAPLTFRRPVLVKAYPVSSTVKIGIAETTIELPMEIPKWIKADWVYQLWLEMTLKPSK